MAFPDTRAPRRLTVAATALATAALALTSIGVAAQDNQTSMRSNAFDPVPQAALAAMPDDLRGRLEGRMAIHSARGGYAPDGTYGDDDTAERSMRIRPSADAYATQTHPFIRTHPETGAETLYSTIGYIIGIEGMSDDEARPLLGELYAWQIRDDFQYRHHWEPKMLVMWDNRCILHRATGGYEGHDRLLHRTTVGYNAAVRTT